MTDNSTDKTSETPPGVAFYKPSAYAPVVGWPVRRSDIDEVDGLGAQCRKCGLWFAQTGDTTQCLLCREKSGWMGRIVYLVPNDGKWLFQPTDFAYCPVCKKPFLHNDLFPDNGDESGVFPCETCVEAKLASGEWRMCEECNVLYDRDQECPHSVEAGDRSDSDDSHENEEQCCQCGEWVEVGELDDALECVDCRTQLDDEDNSESPGGPDDPLEECVRCEESLLPGQLDGWGHCPDCRDDRGDGDE